MLPKEPERVDGEEEEGEKEEEKDEEGDILTDQEQEQLALTRDEFEEWVGQDMDEGGHPLLTDQEIINQISEMPDSSDDEEEEAGQADPKISHVEAAASLSTSLKWLEQQSEATPMDLMLLRELHALAARKRVSNLKQRSIDSFFIPT